MNPYEPPQQEAAAPAESSRRGGKFIRDMLLVAAGTVLLSAGLIRWGEHTIAAWVPALAGSSISRIAARAPAAEPRRQWTVIAAGITMAACVAMFAIPFVRGFGVVLYLPVALGILIVVARVGMAERAVRTRESLLTRDDDQRSHFAEQERREQEPRPRPTAPKTGLRIACSECGELTDENELTFDDGARLCASCARAD